MNSVRRVEWESWESLLSGVPPVAGRWSVEFESERFDHPQINQVYI